LTTSAIELKPRLERNYRDANNSYIIDQPKFESKMINEPINYLTTFIKSHVRPEFEEDINSNPLRIIAKPAKFYIQNN